MSSDAMEDDLARSCSDSHLSIISKDLTEWKMVAWKLGLSEAEVEEVDLTDETPLPLKKIKMLSKWKNKYKKGATYEQLATVFSSLDKNDLAERVRELSTTPSRDIEAPPAHRSVSLFAEHLKTWYTYTDPNDDVWPPIERGKFCRLVMVRVDTKLNRDVMLASLMMGKMDDVITKWVPIDLEHIFDYDCSERKANKKKVILIEGAPGSGKSTLLWHMCQKWASGELFQEFRLVVLIKLREYNITQLSPCSVAGILPCSSDIKESAWSEIQACNGEGVLFLLDGWDELPQNLQNRSIFKEMIKSSPKYSLLRSTVVVTFRYVSSDELLHLGTSRLEILGFTDMEAKECIIDTMNNNEASAALLEAVKSRPSLSSSCYLPLNVKILAYVFQVKGNVPVPSTMLETFKLLIVNCIQRHIRNQDPDANQYESITLLEELPVALQTSFHSLCELAFKGLMEDRQIFSKDELHSIPDHLSLLHGAKTHNEIGTQMVYTFLHHTMQELLAAMHISRMVPGDQLDCFCKHFGDPKFDATIQFYAGITFLQMSEIKKHLYQTIDRNMSALNTDDAISAFCMNPGVKHSFYDIFKAGISLTTEEELVLRYCLLGDEKNIDKNAKFLEEKSKQAIQAMLLYYESSGDDFGVNVAKVIIYKPNSKHCCN